ncbi:MULTISPECIES: uracil-DNA glycosylase [unclassified Sphingomonas]|uniref:uracil-DNA glycosylase n=1 Tax=unclassified Sphingomonas TaxID=196159 RepID=UPI000E10C79D|nr:MULTISPECIES: uracil-DNA glycosylase [unclassified Sphingomonas]AXJ96608.1 uracil-DNA glycosylase [Sphingomonas sp. FARSPH]
MGADQHLDWMGAAASALTWWQDAGVDVLVEDAPRDWLAPLPLDPMPAAAPAQVVPASLVIQPTAAMPDTLDAFVAWRLGRDAPEAAWRGISVAASGPPDAAIMVLADCPDKDDGDAGTLLSGAAGRLFDRMLAAIGLSRDVVHIAAVCARRPVAGRMPREVEARLTDIARHHVGLIAPKRLLLLGNAASRAILSAEMPGTRGSLHPFNHRRGTTDVVATFHPRFLIEKPAAKAEAWKDLQLLMGDWPA